MLRYLLLLCCLALLGCASDEPVAADAAIEAAIDVGRDLTPEEDAAPADAELADVVDHEPPDPEAGADSE